jgi:hypothetical protein
MQHDRPVPSEPSPVRFVAVRSDGRRPSLAAFRDDLREPRIPAAHVVAGATSPLSPSGIARSVREENDSDGARVRFLR